MNLRKTKTGSSQIVNLHRLSEPECSCSSSSTLKETFHGLPTEYCKFDEVINEMGYK